MSSSTAMFGLVTRRECWLPTWRGWLVALVGLLVVGWGGLLGLHPFLAVTDRVDARVLVVEGWVPDNVIAAAIAEFRTGRYDFIYATGGPPSGTSGPAADFDTEAAWGAGRLLRAGLPRDRVKMAPAHLAGRDRTYTSALALRARFRDHGLAVPAVNVVTEDAHARRTRLLFQEALGADTRVGIIAVPDLDYDPHRWWRYSAGFRGVIGEAIAYVYAKFLFWPSLEHTGGQG